MEAIVVTPDVVGHSHPIKKFRTQKSESAQIQVQDEELMDGLAPHPLPFSTLKALDQSYHNKALSFKAICIAGLGYKILDKDGNELPKPQVMIQANEKESFQEIMNKVALDFEELGNAYLEVHRPSANGKIIRIYHVPAENMYVTPDGDRYSQVINGTRVDFRPFNGKATKAMTKEIIHFQMPSNMSNYYGSPDWIGAVMAIVVDNSALEWNYRYFENNTIPNTAITVTGGALGEQVVQNIKQFFSDNFKGVSKAHSTLILQATEVGASIEFHEISKGIKDGDFNKLRQQLRDEIVSAHGVPPRVVGIVAGGSLGGGGEAYAQLQLFRDVLLAPKQKLFEAILNRTVMATFGDGVTIEFNQVDITVPSSGSDDTGGNPALAEHGVPNVSQRGTNATIENTEDGYSEA